MSQSGQLFGYGMESEDVVVRRVTRRVSRYVVELQALKQELERARPAAPPNSGTPSSVVTSLGSEAPHFEFADEVPTLVARARGEAAKRSEDTGTSAVPSAATDESSQESLEHLDITTACGVREDEFSAAPLPPVPPPPPVSHGPFPEASLDAEPPGAIHVPSEPVTGGHRDVAAGEPETEPNPTATIGFKESAPRAGIVVPDLDTALLSRESKRAGDPVGKGTTPKPNTGAKVAAAPQRAAAPKNVLAPPPVPTSAVPSSRLSPLSSAPPSSSPALSEWSKEANPTRWSPPVLLALIIGMSIALAGLVYFLLTFNKYVY